MKPAGGDNDRSHKERSKIPNQPSAKCFSWTKRFLWKQQARTLVWRSSRNIWSTGNDRGSDLSSSGSKNFDMFIFHVWNPWATIIFTIINCCLIFSEMLTPVVGGQISAGQPEGGETQSIAGSVLVGAPCPAPREDGQVQRIFRPNDQTEDNVVRDCWWCSLGQLCRGKSSCSVIVWNS